MIRSPKNLVFFVLLFLLAYGRSLHTNEHFNYTTHYNEDEDDSWQFCSIKDVVYRIDRHVGYLTSLIEKYKKLWSLLRLNKFPILRFIGPNKAYLDYLVVDPEISFGHPLMKSCLDGIKKNKNLNGFFSTWASFEAGNVKRERLFLKEFSVLLIIIYTNIWKNSVKGRSMRLSLPDLISLYQKASGLPMLKLLDALDEFLSQFEPLLAEYDIEDASWPAWKRWLLRKGVSYLVVLAAITYKVLTRGNTIIQPRDFLREDYFSEPAWQYPIEEKFMVRPQQNRPRYDIAFGE
ncbi:hypothetical protein HN446_04945 [bacterium]|jgi:hypothetical protein|nr:hypothetical protein [bacterium]